MVPAFPGAGGMAGPNRSRKPVKNAPATKAAASHRGAGRRRADPRLCVLSRRGLRRVGHGFDPALKVFRHGRQRLRPEGFAIGQV